LLHSSEQRFAPARTSHGDQSGKVQRLKEQQKLRNEQHRLKALQDSLVKANKVKPVDTKSGRIILEKEIFDELHVHSINELIGYLPGFYILPRSGLNIN